MSALAPLELLDKGMRHHLCLPYPPLRFIVASVTPDEGQASQTGGLKAGAVCLSLSAEPGCGSDGASSGAAAPPSVHQASTCPDAPAATASISGHGCAAARLRTPGCPRAWAEAGHAAGSERIPLADHGSVGNAQTVVDQGSDAPETDAVRPPKSPRRPPAGAEVASQLARAVGLTLKSRDVGMGFCGKPGNSVLAAGPATSGASLGSFASGSGPSKSNALAPATAAAGEECDACAAGA
mmetsp:Transcript_75623/g.213958  ORF Transcript_75623/g.213958 Transcript_75623/m.213958 type:complete len:239 (-) Transcript_75623:353-1069(-)